MAHIAWLIAGASKDPRVLGHPSGPATLDEADAVADEEARDFWLQFLPPDRVLPFGKKDNCWEVRVLRFSIHMAWRGVVGMYVCVFALHAHDA